MFPRIYQDMPCPLDGYEGYVFRVLANPTGQEKVDFWSFGDVPSEGCADCKASKRAYCDQHQRARDRFGRGAVAIYGTSRVEGFDFSTPDAALDTFAMPDLPEEFLTWLYLLPGALWAARADDVKKKLPLSSITGDFTTNSV